jgi:hypothetical protein
MFRIITTSISQSSWTQQMATTKFLLPQQSMVGVINVVVCLHACSVSKLIIHCALQFMCHKTSLCMQIHLSLTYSMDHFDIDSGITLPLAYYAILQYLFTCRFGNFVETFHKSPIWLWWHLATVTTLMEFLGVTQNLPCMPPIGCSRSCDEGRCSHSSVLTDREGRDTLLGWIFLSCSTVNFHQE